MQSEAALELTGIGLQIGGARILHDISMTVFRNEMVGVIGPNGAGKTSLFNVISGIAVPTSGSVSLGGIDITRTPIHRRASAGLGRSFQSSNLFAELTVKENVRLAARAHAGGAASLARFSRDGAAAGQAADGYLQQVGVLEQAASVAGSLSHGEKRKLEIAMLLAGEPTVVLLDEPLAGVSSGDVAGLEATIKELHDGGRTVLMVEHHLEVLLGLVDRVAVMHHGELLAYGTPDEITADRSVQSAYLGEPL